MYGVTGRTAVDLSALTTLRTGGSADLAASATTPEELVDAVRSADAAARAVLLIGDGSNLVASDQGWPGDLILIRSRGIEHVQRSGEVTVGVAAGEPWDEVVAHTVEAGWSGLECLSGIPGRTGATPVQNVGAYGQEVADAISVVEALDRDSGKRVRLSAAACRFGYRDSRFKHSDRFVVLAVRFRLRVSLESAPIRYPELAARLGIAVGDRAPGSDVRAAVLDLRRAKGMALDATDHDTWSVGSFFTNPILTPTEYARFAERTRAFPGAHSGWPAYPDPKGRKLSAAWLIEQAGFAKGYSRGPAAVSGKHTLALTNRGAASSADILALADEITAKVHSSFGVRLRPEPRILHHSSP